MRIATIAVALQATIVSVGVLGAQTPTDATLFVSANMDIYKAGGYQYYNSYSGVPPYSYTFHSGAYKGLVFFNVSGLWTCNAPGNTPYGSDGTSVPGNCYPRAVQWLACS